MDPVTILKIASAAASTAKAAWDVGEGIYTFCNDVRVINSTISDMVAEVKALSSACTLVDERLRGIVQDFEAEVRESAADRRKLWKCIEIQIMDSKLSVSQLERALEDIKKERSNTFAQAWRQIKLNMKARDIREARNRIRSHTASLQIILQTVTIEICYIVPQRADQHLQLLLSGVKECLDQLKAIREEGIEQHAEDNQGTVIRLSESVASEGDSLYASSVASGSLLGDTSWRSSKIRDWMKDIHAIDEIASRSMHTDDAAESSPGSSHETVLRVGYPRTIAFAQHAESGQEHCAEVEADSDDELLAEVAKEALDVARTSFESKDYGEAASYLREALKVVRELPAQRQRICNTFELRWMLSVCAYHTLQSHEAEADLLSILDLSAKIDDPTDNQLVQLCDAGHLLAQVYIKLGKLEQARLSCDNALQGRRRLLGKNSAEACASIALMARILELQGKAYRAKLYLRLIPEDKQMSVDGAFDSLSPQVERVEYPPEAGLNGMRLQGPSPLWPSTLAGPKAQKAVSSKETTTEAKSGVREVGTLRINTALGETPPKLAPDLDGTSRKAQATEGKHSCKQEQTSVEEETVATSGTAAGAKSPVQESNANLAAPFARSTTKHVNTSSPREPNDNIHGRSPPHERDLNHPRGEPSASKESLAVTSTHRQIIRLDRIADRRRRLHPTLLPSLDLGAAFTNEGIFETSRVHVPFENPRTPPDPKTQNRRDRFKKAIDFDTNFETVTIAMQEPTRDSLEKMHASFEIVEKAWSDMLDMAAHGAFDMVTAAADSPVGLSLSFHPQQQQHIDSCAYLLLCPPRACISQHPEVCAEVIRGQELVSSIYNKAKKDSRFPGKKDATKCTIKKARVRRLTKEELLPLIYRNSLSGYPDYSMREPF